MGTNPCLDFKVSYLTFRAGMIIEMRDGVLKEFTLWEFLRLCSLCRPSKWADWSFQKRFNEDYKTIPEREELLDMLEQAVKCITYGFLYKFILAHIFGHLLLDMCRPMPCLKVDSSTSERWGHMFMALTSSLTSCGLFDVCFSSNLMGIKVPSTWSSL